VILNLIREKGPISRVEASRMSALSVATAKRVIDELLAQGLVAEGEPGPRPGRGRKAASLRLNGGHGHAVGVSLEPGALEVQAVDFSGKAVYARRLTPDTSRRQETQALLMKEAEAAVSACRLAGQGPLLGIGVGIAGLVDAREGTVQYCPGLPGWEGMPLAAELANAFGARAVVDDAVRCMALAEKRHGAARDLDTFLLIYMGSGVGSGIILDNRIYRGSHGVSGEFGHITVRENGPLCKCGNRGCLEALASAPAVLARVADSLNAAVYSSLGAAGAGALPTLADVYRAARGEDKLANLVIAETEENIGIGIANLINILDPGTVILCGEVVRTFHALMLDGIHKTVRRRALHSISTRTVIRRSAFDADAAALGAATMPIELALHNDVLNL
jgi:N-acetylglucosamine repressor